MPKDKRKTVQKQLTKNTTFRNLTQEWVNLGIELCKLKLRADGKRIDRENGTLKDPSHLKIENIQIQ